MSGIPNRVARVRTPGNKGVALLIRRAGRRALTDMSEHSNVDTINGAYAAFAAADIPGILERLDPSVEWRVPGVVPHGGDFQGHEGAASFLPGSASTGRG
jgi:hypothetical protein